MWGCFFTADSNRLWQSVFPLHVGVFPFMVPQTKFNASLPHACGGVSLLQTATGYGRASSPCMWGCFHDSNRALHLRPVFPMHVGVFLNRIKPIVFNGCLPHACGGVSFNLYSLSCCTVSSPCMWGCFYNNGKLSYTMYVFPMHVGVFPRYTLIQK